MKTKTEKHTPELEPFIWLQENESKGKADSCPCRLENGDEGPAFFMCVTHEAAPNLLRAAQNVRCECTPKEVFSGHRIDCWMPEFEEAIAKIEGR